MDSAPSPSASASIAVFNAFSIIGLSSLTLVLVTALISPNVHRSRTWFSLLISWLAWDIAYLLLIRFQTGDNIPLGLCMIQTGLIYAVPIWSPAAGAAFLAEVVWDLHIIFFNKTVTKRTNTIRNLLVAGPLVIFLVMSLAVIGTVQTAEDVSRAQNHMYCHLTRSGTIALITRALCGFFSLMNIVIEVWAFFLLYRHWTAFRRYNFSTGNARLSRPLILRALGYNIIPTLGVILTVAASYRPVDSLQPIWVVIILIPPIVFAVTFGSQKDFLLAWASVFRKSTPTATSSSIPISLETPRWSFHEENARKVNVKS